MCGKCGLFLWKKEQAFCGDIIKMIFADKKFTKNVDILIIKIQLKNVLTILTI